MRVFANLRSLMNLNYLEWCVGLVKNTGPSPSRQTLCQCVLGFSVPFPFPSKSELDSHLWRGETSKQWDRVLITSIKCYDYFGFSAIKKKSYIVYVPVYAFLKTVSLALKTPKKLAWHDKRILCG